MPSSARATPSPFRSDPEKGEKSRPSGLAKQAIQEQSRLPIRRRPARGLGSAGAPAPPPAALLSIAASSGPEPGTRMPPSVCVHGVVGHGDAAEQPALLVVLEPDSALEVPAGDVVADDGRPSPHHDPGGSSRAAREVPLDH